MNRVVLPIVYQRRKKARYLQSLSKANFVHEKNRQPSKRVLKHFDDADELVPTRTKRNSVGRISEPFAILFIPRVTIAVDILSTTDSWDVLILKTQDRPKFIHGFVAVVVNAF